MGVRPRGFRDRHGSRCRAPMRPVQAFVPALLLGVVCGCSPVIRSLDRVASLDAQMHDVRLATEYVPRVHDEIGDMQASLAKMTKELADVDTELRKVNGDTSSMTTQIETLSREMFPGVAVIPTINSGATDGRFLTPIGIPTYGVSGMLGDGATGNAHGLNERIRVQSLIEGREFLYRLTKLYAGGK